MAVATFYTNNALYAMWMDAAFENKLSTSRSDAISHSRFQRLAHSGVKDMTWSWPLSTLNDGQEMNLILTSADLLGG